MTDLRFLMDLRFITDLRFPPFLLIVLLVRLLVLFFFLFTDFLLPPRLEEGNEDIMLPSPFPISSLTISKVELLLTDSCTKISVAALSIFCFFTHFPKSPLIFSNKAPAGYLYSLRHIETNSDKYFVSIMSFSLFEDLPFFLFIDSFIAIKLISTFLCMASLNSSLKVVDVLLYNSK